MLKIKSEVANRNFELVKLNAKKPPKHLESADDLKTLYGGRFDEIDGTRYRFYVGRSKKDTKQVLFWYAKHGELHCSFGKNMASAVDMGIKDGWMYA